VPEQPTKMMAIEQPKSLGVYNQTEIRVRGTDDFVDATAMCQATGKRWAKYWENAGTQDFLNSLARNLKCPKSDLLFSDQGRGGGTWVCEEVAMNLAQWCSADFAAWASIQLAAIRRGKRVAHPERAEAQIANIQNDISVLHSRFEGLMQQMLTVQEQQNAIMAELLPMVKRIDERTQGKREGFDSEAKRKYIVCVQEYFGGNCPCCLKVKVAEGGKTVPHVSQFDHYHHRSMNKLEHGWLVCKTCNNKLKDRKPSGFWFRVGPDFLKFQRMLHLQDSPQRFLGFMEELSA
jgi:hypothetical protein